MKANSFLQENLVFEEIDKTKKGLIYKQLTSYLSMDKLFFKCMNYTKRLKNNES